MTAGPKVDGIGARVTGVKTKARRCASKSDGWKGWNGALLALLSLALARALLIAARDGWWSTGLYPLAARSFARHAALGLALVAPPVLVLGFVLHGPIRRPASLPRAGLLLVAFVFGLLFVSGWLPALPFHRLEFRSAAEWAASVAAALAALAAVFLLRFGLYSRTTGAAAGLVAAAVLAIHFAPGWFGLSPRENAGSRSVILVSLDTVRADRLGCYGYERGTTPAIDRFARTALRFEHAYSSAPWTLTAHMTMLTGLYPSVHGVENQRVLPESARTLAELLSARGLVSAAQVHCVNWMAREYGFARGFQTYRWLGGRAEFKIDCARELFEDLRGEPFFLFLHFYDAHSDIERLPYDSAAEDREMFAGWYRGSFTGCDEQGRCATNFLASLNSEGQTLEGDERRFLSDLYDSGLRTMDRALERLFALLENEGLLDRSIIILTADHGEAFFEHGKALHGQLYEECVRVPLLVRIPGRPWGSSSELVGLVDLAPTILELCGLDPPDTMQGRSLAPILLGGPPAQPRSHIVFDWGWDQIGVRTPAWKVANFSWHGVGTEALQVYDLRQDPREERSLSFDDLAPSEAEHLWSLLELERSQAVSLRERLGPAPSIARKRKKELE